MIFSKNVEVIYHGMYGIIDYVSDDYLVIEIIKSQGECAPRLLVYKENYKDIEIIKASTK
jgi:hypothetical protein